MSFGDFLSGYYDVGVQLPEYLKKKAQSYFEKEALEKESIKTREDFEKRRDRIRKFYIESIGGLDFERTPLNSVCTGIVEREGYSIKKIIFQSLPGIYVTSNLYMPDNIKGKAPAILFASGHAENAKAYPKYQKVCIDLVKNGFIVLSVDPICQGERMQHYDIRAGRNLVRWHADHTYLGLQCELVGSSIVRYFLWDLIRAVDYLCSLPEVDPDRIGMTGNSGGAMQTTFMMMGDDRIKAAMPCTYITSREGYMRTGQPQDGEQITFGAISRGINFDDYITCFAPKPVMIGAVESDFFVIEGVLQTYERARKIYRLLGCEDNVRLGLVKGTHEYNDELRQIAVNWFTEIFKGEKGNFVTDPGMKVEDVRTLQCTESGQVMAEFGDARTVFELNAEYYQKNRYTYTSDLTEIKRRLKKILNMPESRDRIYPRVISTRRINNEANIMDDLNHRNIFFFSEKDIMVAGIYVEVVGRESDRCTILVLEEGANDIYKENDLVNVLLKKGDVFAFDPRGMGVVKSRPVNGRPFYEVFGTEYKLNCDAMMMEQSLMGYRVYDILRACDFIRQEYPNKKISLAGKGIGALYALFATVLDDDVDGAHLINMISSFEDIALKRYYRYDPRYSIYGVLKELDIPMLLEALKEKDIFCFNEPDTGNIIRW